MQPALRLELNALRVRLQTRWPGDARLDRVAQVRGDDRDTMSAGQGFQARWTQNMLGHVMGHRVGLARPAPAEHQPQQPVRADRRYLMGLRRPGVEETVEFFEFASGEEREKLLKLLDLDSEPSCLLPYPLLAGGRCAVLTVRERGQGVH